MTKQEFLDKLKSKLLSAGLSEEVCDQKCAAISRGFSKLSEDEARQYFTGANVDMIADRLIQGDPKQHEKPQSSPVSASSPKPTEPKTAQPRSGSVMQPESGKGGESASPAAAPTIVIPKSDGKTPGKSGGKQDSDIAKVSGSADVVFVNSPSSSGSSGKRGLFLSIDDSVMSRGSQNPKLLLTVIIILCAPMFLFCAFAVLGLSLVIALAMASVILAVVCVIAAIVGGGSVLATLSLIYGITQIISEPRYVGLHEIGLAMLFAGITILISVLLYNVAVRLIPFIYKLIGTGLKTLGKKVKALLVLAWKGCKSL